MAAQPTEAAAAVADAVCEELTADWRDPDGDQCVIDWRELHVLLEQHVLAALDAAQEPPPAIDVTPFVGPFAVKWGMLVVDATDACVCTATARTTPAMLQQICDMLNERGAWKMGGCQP